MNAIVWEASGTAERDTALVMLEQIAGTKWVTVGGGYFGLSKPSLARLS